MATILITGGTGMIGKALTATLLEKGYSVIILSRNPEQQTTAISKLNYAKWNIEQDLIDPEAIIKADHIIHLAGAGVADKRWTNKRKKEILNSRIQSAALLVNTLKNNLNNVKTVISSSAIGWYGPDRQGTANFIEEDPPFDDFLGQTCLQWENSIEPVKDLGKRLVKIRTGIVLSNTGGA